MPFRFTAYMFAVYDEHPRLSPNGRPIESKAEGEVWYCIVNDARAHHFIQQFRRGNLMHESDRNLWSWDGNRKEPTIKPSFLVPDYHFHCFVTRGKIDVLPDSHVEDVAKRMTWNEFMEIEGDK